MVGVPGRSIACRTCKRRKKGCDGKEPACGQCIRFRVQCEGYDKSRIFVNSTVGSGGACSQTFLPTSYAQFIFTGPNGRGRSLSSTHVLDPTLNHRAQQEQCFDQFWSSLLPNGRLFSHQASRFSTAGWASLVQELCQRDNLVRMALLANAFGLLGKQSGDHRLTVYGWRAYGTALKIMAQSIPAKSDKKMDALLTTSMLLAQYEVLGGSRSLNSTSKTGQQWYHHAYGEQALLLARGPESCTQGLSHQLFSDIRLHMVPMFLTYQTGYGRPNLVVQIYPNLRCRQRCPFSSSEWKTVPWSINCKDPKNELLDILVEIPGIQEDFDELMGSCTDHMSSSALRRSLEEKCWLLDFELQRWSAHSGLRCVDFVKNLVSNKAAQVSAPSSEDCAMAHLGMIYWTTCLLLYLHLERLTVPMPKDIPDRLQPRYHCRNIAQLLPYFQHDNVGEFFLNMTTFSTITVMRFLENHDTPGDISEERRMLREAFKGKRLRQMENFLGSLTDTDTMD